MRTFGFGDRGPETIKGATVLVPEFSLHVQCSWRIVRDGSIVAGYTDWWFPPAGVSEDGWVARDAPRSHQDELMETFIAHGDEAHLVTTATGASTGDLRIWLNDGCLLEVIPDSATQVSEGLEDEYWRLIRRHHDGRHFVVTAHGIET